MAPDEPAVPTAPPDATRLVAMDDDLWRRVVVHLRRSLVEVDGLDPDPRLRRLAAVPTTRLVSGRARRDAAAALAAGGPLWVDLRGRVVADPDLAGPVGRALRTDATPRPEPPPPPSADDGAERDRLRDRLRTVRDERDVARRRADGETARADREAAAREEAEQALARAEARVVELEEALAAAAEDRAAAVDRERRRGEATLAEVTEELRVARRAHQERVRRDRAADRAEQVRAAQTAPPPAPPEPAGLVPGRPSRLPDRVHPDTTEAVDLLLHRGRLVLVDGYNVTRTHRADLDLEGQRRWLVNLLAGTVGARGIEPQVVFDGHQEAGAGSSRRDRGVVVGFTPAGVTADDDLVFAVEALDPARPVVVVTDDRELRERLGPYRVDLVSTRGFLGAIR